MANQGDDKHLVATGLFNGERLFGVTAGEVERVQEPGRQTGGAIRNGALVGGITLHVEISGPPGIANQNNGVPRRFRIDDGGQVGGADPLLLQHGGWGYRGLGA